MVSDFTIGFVGSIDADDTEEDTDVLRRFAGRAEYWRFTREIDVTLTSSDS